MAAPAFTLGTANAAGSAETAVASDSTLLAFDTTLPSAVGTAATGSAVVAVRRDHVHAGVTGSGTVVDEAITRFNGTGGSSLQGYSSLSPTISDAGIISLTSGALKFPATAITSTEANTLWDYEEGVWTPALNFGGGDTSITYNSSNTVGSYEKIGRTVFYRGVVQLTNKGSSTGNAEIIGLPFAGVSSYDSNTPSAVWAGSISFANQIEFRKNNGSASIALLEVTESGSETVITDSNFANDSIVGVNGQYRV